MYYEESVPCITEGIEYYRTLRDYSLGFPYLSLRIQGDPNNKVLGPKFYDGSGIWALKPCYSGPWTLRLFQASTYSLETTGPAESEARHHES